MRSPTRRHSLHRQAAVKSDSLLLVFVLSLFLGQLALSYELIAHWDVVLLFTGFVDTHQMTLATAQKHILNVTRIGARL